MKHVHLMRLFGASAVVSGSCLGFGQVLFWLVVPEVESERQDRQAIVICTAVLWLTAHSLLALALIGVYLQVFRRVGAFGGAGFVMGLFGTIGLCLYIFFLFPELIGFRPDSFQDFQIALALQALGELGAALLIAGLVLLSVAMIVARAFPVLWPTMVAAGALLAPFGFEDLRWLALGGVLVGVGMFGMGLVILRGQKQPSRTPWPAQTQSGQFRF